MDTLHLSEGCTAIQASDSSSFKTTLLLLITVLGNALIKNKKRFTIFFAMSVLTKTNTQTPHCTHPKWILKINHELMIYMHKILKTY